MNEKACLSNRPVIPPTGGGDDRGKGACAGGVSDGGRAQGGGDYREASSEVQLGQRTALMGMAEQQ